MRIQIATVTPAASHDYFARFAAALQTSDAAAAVVRAGFAYATIGGVESLMEKVESVSHWTQMSKQFLIGVHHGITEPAALDRLRRIPRAELRLVIPTRALSVASLTARPLFHPKVLAIDDRATSTTRFLQAGSANLTSFAVGAQPANYEIGLSIYSKGPSLDQRRVFQQWWGQAWGQARRADVRLIEQYAAVRHLAFEGNPILRMSSEVPDSIETAEHLFIEVGAASGPPGQRHQIEFPESLVRFFGKPKLARRDIALRSGTHVWDQRPLSHKRTTYGVDIWRLGMPTQTSGGEPIAERVIKFRRLAPHEFEFEIADNGSRKVTRWAKLANAVGHVGATHGLRGRRYGFY